MNSRKFWYGVGIIGGLGLVALILALLFFLVVERSYKQCSVVVNNILSSCCDRPKQATVRKKQNAVVPVMKEKAVKEETPCSPVLPDTPPPPPTLPTPETVPNDTPPPPGIKPFVMGRVFSVSEVPSVILLAFSVVPLLASRSTL